MFNEDELKVARCLVTEFQRKFKTLKREGYEDLLQDCLTHWLFARDKYKPGYGASVKTFMERIIKRRLINIAKEKERLKRRAFYTSVSLEELLDGGDSGFIEKFLKADDEGFNLLMKSDLPIALSKAVDKLSFRQKELCRLLGEEGMNINEASKHMNIPRSTLQEEVKRIREVFRKDGLENYLE
ncbi:MAG TPA: sigma-70 family RNA polymerase sigma factor [Candidatus Omnitrophota bacterium]|nr:sigma-70 family RNA polymerase sigma factor [Candidatus Omnitrophota bacterium]